MSQQNIPSYGSIPISQYTWFYRVNGEQNTMGATEQQKDFGQQPVGPPTA